MSPEVDRSDGRPDLGLPVVASKFDSFVSTCLRLGGFAWTEVIGPLEYLGFKTSNYWKREMCAESGQKVLTLDTPGLFDEVMIRLLDIPKEKIVNTLVNSEENRLAVWNLCFAICRVAFRFTIFEHEFSDGATEPDSQNLNLLRVNYCNDRNDGTLLPSYILESVLSLDMQVKYSLDSSNKCFAVASEDLLDWKKINRG